MFQTGLCFIVSFMHAMASSVCSSGFYKVKPSISRPTTATPRPWRSCCRGPGRWTRATRPAGRPSPWPRSGDTRTASTHCSARGRRRTPWTPSTDARPSTWPVGLRHGFVWLTRFIFTFTDGRLSHMSVSDLVLLSFCDCSFLY